MKKIITLIISFIMLFSLPSCGSGKTTHPSDSTTDHSTTIPSTDPNPTTTEPKEDDPFMNKTIELKIGNTKVEVNWLDSESVKELKKLAKDGLTINMSMYGDFEQVGSLGKTIISDDERITTSPGDIVLYSSNQIVIFYGSNTWSYTKLGHISLSKSELTDLLGDEDVVITLSLE